MMLRRLRLRGPAAQGAYVGDNTNAAPGWFGNPMLVSGDGFRDRDMALTLFCHECEREFPDHSNLDAREIGGTHVFLSCPSCKRDLAIVQIQASGGTP